MRILSAVAAVAFILAGAVAAPAVAQPSKDVALPACFDPPGVGETLTCGCQISEAGNAVWGIGPYTSDSDICTAATHAGLMTPIQTPDGPALFGEFDVTGSDGCEAYASSEANGVTTTAYGSWSQSFFFPAVQTGDCSNGFNQGKPVVDFGGAEICPDTMPDGAKSLTCGCTAEATQDGFVWGTDRYTADSTICRAALHFGAVGPAGGLVSVARLGAGESFIGSQRNGVTTLDYGTYPETIEFR